MTLDKNNLEELRKISVLDLANVHGLTFKKEGSSYYRSKSNGLNLVINTRANSFVDNASLVSGVGSLDLLTKLFGYSFKDAYKYLGGETKNFKKIEVKQTEEKEREYKALPLEVKENNKAVFNYLVTKRKLNPNLVQTLINKNLIYADKYKNACFVNNGKTFVFSRGTYEIKGKDAFTRATGKPDFITYNFGNKQKIYLFEGSIDALSYKTMFRNKKGTFVVTSGNMMIKHIKDLIKEDTKQVVCCFDNDAQGKMFAEKIKEDLAQFKHIKLSIHKPKGKDFNQDLISKKGIERWNLM